MCGDLRVDNPGVAGCEYTARPHGSSEAWLKILKETESVSANEVSCRVKFVRLELSSWNSSFEDLTEAFLGRQGLAAAVGRVDGGGHFQISRACCCKA